jgi:hypothetical protein
MSANFMTEHYPRPGGVFEESSDLTVIVCIWPTLSPADAPRGAEG